MKFNCKCGRMAVWLLKYAYCEDCVPRGCSCNSSHKEEFDHLHSDESILDSIDACLDESHWMENLDEQGRRQPCCEYLFDEEGFDEEGFDDE